MLVSECLLHLHSVSSVSVVDKMLDELLEEIAEQIKRAGLDPLPIPDIQLPFSMDNVSSSLFLVIRLN